MTVVKEFLHSCIFGYKLHHYCGFGSWIYLSQKIPYHTIAVFFKTLPKNHTSFFIKISACLFVCSLKFDPFQPRQVSLMFMCFQANLRLMSCHKYWPKTEPNHMVQGVQLDMIYFEVPNGQLKWTSMFKKSSSTFKRIRHFSFINQFSKK